MNFTDWIQTILDYVGTDNNALEYSDVSGIDSISYDDKSSPHRFRSPSNQYRSTLQQQQQQSHPREFSQDLQKPVRIIRDESVMLLKTDSSSLSEYSTTKNTAIKSRSYSGFETESSAVVVRSGWFSDADISHVKTTSQNSSVAATMPYRWSADYKASSPEIPALNNIFESLRMDCSTDSDEKCTRTSINQSTSITLGFYAKNTTHPFPGDDKHPLVWMYISPIILLLGIIGNTLTLLVMRRRRLRHTTTSVYLSLMSIADSIALISRICPEFFQSLQLFTFSELCRWTCKLEKFTFYSSSDVAIWLLVAFTFDRLIAVCFPLQKRRVCVPRKACLAATVITILAALKNLHVFWSRDVLETTAFRCGWVEPFKYFEEFIRPWIAFTLVSAIPFTFILICNCLIVRTLTIVRRIGSSTATTPSTARRSASFAQTSWMCFSVSLTFLACVTPSIVLSIGRAYWSKEPHRSGYNLARAVNNQLACANHAVNFFLYCLTGQRFRSELLRMLTFSAATSSSAAAAAGVGTLGGGEMGSMVALGPNSYFFNNGVAPYTGRTVGGASTSLLTVPPATRDGRGGRLAATRQFTNNNRRIVTS